MTYSVTIMPGIYARQARQAVTPRLIWCRAHKEQWPAVLGCPMTISALHALEELEAILRCLQRVACRIRQSRRVLRGESSIRLRRVGQETSACEPFLILTNIFPRKSDSLAVLGSARAGLARRCKQRQSEGLCSSRSGRRAHSEGESFAPRSYDQTCLPWSVESNRQRDRSVAPKGPFAMT